MASQITSTTQFQELTSSNSNVIALFYAEGSEPCTLMDEAVGELLAEGLGFQCAKIEAEKVPDLTAHLKVASVPTAVFLTKGIVVDRVEGFQPAELFEKADAHKPVDLQARLKQLTTSQTVMLFMKGSPEAPRCGFSKRVVAALQHDGIKFGSFDILSDEEVRQGLKEYSEWPTYPQLYAGGELLGGCDIILEMAGKEELLPAVQDAAKEAGMTVPSGKEIDAKPLEQRIKELLSSAPVVLLMKGSPDEPRCGFSRKVVDALRKDSISFNHFDILQDEEIRQGVKQYSEWPTYPQLYANSELVGGCDIILEMSGTGDLLGVVQSSMAGS